jgi:hypothetical protein
MFQTQVDGVTRCLARLLAHLREMGHEAVVLGPNSGMVSNLGELLYRRLVDPHYCTRSKGRI